MTTEFPLSNENRHDDRITRLRILNPPLPTRIDLDQDGMPTYYRSKNGKHLRVSIIRERWRIDDEWWREEISRDYFTLVLENGMIVTVFQNLLSHKWYSQ
ncbi:MAG: hypothetical protein VX384_00100 [Gemmatimonadota bacterium]|nr:hypothetical protein [Gemmatimonadota bacterium]